MNKLNQILQTVLEPAVRINIYFYFAELLSLLLDVGKIEKFVLLGTPLAPDFFPEYSFEVALQLIFDLGDEPIFWMPKLGRSLLLELMVAVNMLEHFEELGVHALAAEEAELGHPELWLVDPYFIFLHVGINLIFIANHAGVGQQLPKSRAIFEPRGSSDSLF